MRVTQKEQNFLVLSREKTSLTAINCLLPIFTQEQIKNRLFLELEL